MNIISLDWPSFIYTISTEYPTLQPAIIIGLILFIIALIFVYEQRCKHFDEIISDYESRKNPLAVVDTYKEELQIARDALDLSVKQRQRLIDERKNYQKMSEDKQKSLEEKIKQLEDEQIKLRKNIEVVEVSNSTGSKAFANIAGSAIYTDYITGEDRQSGDIWTEWK